MIPDVTHDMYYIIRVREKLDESWEDWFEPLSVTADGEGTILAGHLPDQSALHGVIGRVQRLGLHLVAVNPGQPPLGAGVGTEG